MARFGSAKEGSGPYDCRLVCIGERAGLRGASLDRGAGEAGERNPLVVVDSPKLELKLPLKLVVRQGEHSNGSPPLILMLDPKDLSMSIGRSVSVHVGERGGDEWKRDRRPSVIGEESIARGCGWANSDYASLLG